MQRGPRLCRLCECPVTDGGVRASEVDRERFEEWCLNFLETLLADKIKRGDYFCYTCVSDAEVLLNSQEIDNSERFRWWPKRAGRKELNSVKQVEPEKNLPPPARRGKGEAVGRRQEKQPKKQAKCIYCGKQKNLRYWLSEHMKKKHKSENVIRCTQCIFYFHTIEDREKHIQEVHKKPKVLEIFSCTYCSKSFSGNHNYRQHVRRSHSALKFKCNLRGCISYFKSQIELESHNKIVHQTDGDCDGTLKCDICSFYFRSKIVLSSHFLEKHLEKTAKCGKCPEMFASDTLLRKHMRFAHVYKFCNLCQTNVALKVAKNHFGKRKCRSCKEYFPCSGILGPHFQKCKQKVHKCDICSKTFSKQSVLGYHKRVKHQLQKNFEWRGLKHKSLDIKCETCRRYFRHNGDLRYHLKLTHNINSSFLYCAHCPKKFQVLFYLKAHLAEQHDLIERKYQCFHCEKKCFVLGSLKSHLIMAHLQTSVKCRLCSKVTLHKNMSTHMLRIHGVRK